MTLRKNLDIQIKWFIKQRDVIYMLDNHAVIKNNNVDLNLLTEKFCSCYTIKF